MNDSDPGLEKLLSAAVEAVGGADRPGQRAMASAIERSIDLRRHLIAQAGTGTGKSLAYLVPALKRAVERGTPVVITTATLALQSQIVAKDLPRIVEALGTDLGRVPSYSLLKGRGNYVCLHKLEGGYPDDLDPGALFAEASVTGVKHDSERLGAQVQRLREWAQATDTGDRDELDTPVSDRAWRQVSVTGSQCIGTSCPFHDECFAERNRALAREADVVVTNHALYAIDAFDGHGIIPEHDVVIVDEAHEFVDRVTSSVTESLHQGAIRGAVRELRRLGITAIELDDAGVALEEALSPLPDGRVRGELEPRLRDTLTIIRAEAESARDDVKNAGDAAEISTAGARASVRARLAEILNVCDRLLDPHEDDVIYLNHSEALGRTFIDVAPLSVAGLVKHGILDERTAIFTSATLAFNGRFDSAAYSFGLRGEKRAELESDVGASSGEGPREWWSALDVGSPFAYARQGILYVASHLPAPGRDGTSSEMLEHIVELIEASGGGALGLFSSRRAAEEAAEYVRRMTGRTVLLQGEDSNAALAARFRESRDACLFGTRTFWQGIDVAGQACRLVIIDRIPFPRPDDPLASARQERLARLGRNGFYEVAVRSAALSMAQGAGRLIRTETDRGMVAVLDSRLATKSYGSAIRQAIPPLWATREPEVAIAALERLRSELSE
ncbi:hypothetical protein DAD186_16270 [Dermabacter vaginalis]|uniref:DNA 5'-3' helicase n=1 Tax=Dermabacter vaginalis TaxID=1630135 RepID=A0A1B0ZJV6_9MICO|nr:ATP-dependent DNA helicase [Dermabacter vaginalis]ANP28177.1 hypothetical protein DAD186_16270 [Dermabacter vaginalis]